MQRVLSLVARGDVDLDDARADLLGDGDEGVGEPLRLGLRLRDLRGARRVLRALRAERPLRLRRRSRSKERGASSVSRRRRFGSSSSGEQNPTPLFARQVSSAFTRSPARLLDDPRPRPRACRRAQRRRAAPPGGARSVSSIVGAPRAAARREPSATSAATHALGSHAGSIAKRPRMARLTGRNGGSSSATASVAEPRSSPRESTATSSDGSPAVARPRWAAIPPTSVASTAARAIEAQVARRAPPRRERRLEERDRERVTRVGDPRPIPCPPTGTAARRAR